MFKPTVRKLLQGAAVVAVSALLAVPALAQKTKLTVYTALENDQLGAYKQAFEAAHNDVEIAWVRDSTGVITANGSEPQNPLIPANTNETGGGKILDLLFAGLVYYDADGDGAGARVRFAELDGAPVLHFSDFVIA